MSSESRVKMTKGRSVPSRFKQSAEKYSTQSSSGTSSSETMKSRYQFNVKKNSNLLSSDWNTTKANVTTCRKTTSTPDQNCTALPAFDASAITSVGSSFCVTQRKEKEMQTTLTSTVARKPIQKKTTNVALFSNGPVKCKEIRTDPNQVAKTQKAELDIYYAQYQLSLLLENKLKRSLQSRSKLAMGKIYKVVCFIKVLLTKNESHQQGLNLMSFFIKLHEHLQRQEKMLLSSIEIIPTLERQYEEIAIAVDSIRHKLRVKDVLLPDVASEGEIIQLLENIGNLLDQVLKTVDNVNEINLTAVAANTFVCQGKLIADEIKRGSELLAESRDLLLSETSLKLASLELK